MSLFDPTKSGPTWALTAALCGTIAGGALAYAGLADKDWAAAEHKAQEVRITVVEKQVLTVQADVDKANDGIERVEAGVERTQDMLEAMMRVEYERSRTQPEHQRAWRRAAKKMSAPGQANPLEAVQEP